MSKREELADLLARQNGYTSLLAMPASQRDNWRKRADAVLDALMEPTEGMIGEGYDALMDWDARTGDDYGIFETFRAMIQAAKGGK